MGISKPMCLKVLQVYKYNYASYITVDCDLRKCLKNLSFIPMMLIKISLFLVVYKALSEPLLHFQTLFSFIKSYT